MATGLAEKSTVLALGKRKLPLKVLVLTIFALLLSLALAVVLSFNLTRMRESFGWVQHTNAVLRQLAAAEKQLLEAESSERGYLLAGERIYLENYHRAQVAIPGLLSSLGELTSDNAAQTVRIDQLRTNINARLDEFRRAIEFGPTRLADALAILTTAQFRQLTPEIERDIAEIRRAELTLLEDRQRTADASVTTTTIITATLSILLVLGAAIGAFLLERQNAMGDLRLANDQLAKSRDEVEEREAHLQAILATVPDAMVVISERGLIQSFSSAGEAMFGYCAGDVFGSNVQILMPEPYRSEHDGYLTRYLTTGERRIIGTGRVVVGQRADGTTFPMELSVGEVQMKGHRHFVGFVRDLTQRQDSDRMLHEVQAEMFHMSRLSSMGEMASALAHELNQPLSAVSNYLQGARRLIDALDTEHAVKVKTALNKATEQALRAGQVIQRLRSFVARGETEKQIERLSKIIEETSALALVGAKEQSVRVNLKFSSSSDYVLIDKVQIQQVLLNLMRNALESMQSSSRRELIVSTGPAPDGMISVRVADTGSGIDPEGMEKLFQPFFTTKKQGMGVGLSISRSIVESHGGKINVEPNPHGGTIFCFTLRGVEPEEVAT
jgi:two-component system, LuxR family, sensor kinase FixL